MKFGSTEILTLETGMFRLDGGAMFGSVPKTLWEKAIPPDELNRIPMALRIVLVRDTEKKRNLLIDTGVGTKSSPKMASIFAIDHSKHTLEGSLKNHGLTPDDITDVVLTHLHFDHVGGATHYDKTGKAVPSFKNAKYYIQKAQFDSATHANCRETASYLPENYMPLVESKQLVICSGAADFDKAIAWPEVTVRISYGHTTGLQCPVIRLGDRIFFYPSDLVPTSAHIPVPWVMGYDIHILKLLEEKEAILEEAVRDRWIFIYEHDPVIPATEIQKGAKHFERGALVAI